MTSPGPGPGARHRTPAFTGLLTRARAGLREQGARSALVAFASTVAFVVLVVWQVGSSDTWPAIRAQFFDRDAFVDAWPAVRRGFWLNIRLFVVAEVVILVVALALAMVRALRGPAFFPLRATVVVFIDVVRGIPIVLLILLLGFGVPALQLPGVTSNRLVWGVAAIVISYSAYTAEVYRSGIEAVHDSQWMAARSIGLSQGQTLRLVVVPQAVRNVIPALLNGLISLQKDVSLVFILGAREAIREAQIIQQRTFNYTPYLAATVLFLAVSVPLARFTDHYAERDRRRRRASG